MALPTNFIRLRQTQIGSRQRQHTLGNILLPDLEQMDAGRCAREERRVTGQACQGRPQSAPL
jgi:hypothetical protein